MAADTAALVVAAVEDTLMGTTMEEDTDTALMTTQVVTIPAGMTQGLDIESLRSYVFFAPSFISCENFY